MLPCMPRTAPRQTGTKKRTGPAAASILVLAGYPSPTDAGFAANFTVTALDPYGNKTEGQPSPALPVAGV